MSFSKKILVLKEIEEGFSINGKRLSGICRIETEDGVSRLFLTVINATAKQDFLYKIMIVDDKKTAFSFSLGSRPTSFNTTLPPSYSVNGVCAGIYAVKNDIPITIAFSKEDGFNMSVADFKKIVAEKCLTEKKEREKQDELRPKNPKVTEPSPIHPPYPPAEQPDPTVTPPEEFPSPKGQEVKDLYDDEAVATENYYTFDKEIELKLNAVKEWTIENVRIEDDEPHLRGKKEKTPSDKDFDCIEDEESSNQREENQENKPFYLTVKTELENIFSKFPPEESLQKTFYDSRWARVNYSPDKYYVVGLVKEEGKEKYICYGVPATYSETPPKELEGYCTFIPLSIFDLSGDGYWVMFQDAISGQCKKPEPV